QRAIASAQEDRRKVDRLSAARAAHPPPRRRAGRNRAGSSPRTRFRYRRAWLLGAASRQSTSDRPRQGSFEPAAPIRSAPGSCRSNRDHRPGRASNKMRPRLLRAPRRRRSFRHWYRCRSQRSSSQRLAQGRAEPGNGLPIDVEADGNPEPRAMLGDRWRANSAHVKALFLEPLRNRHGWFVLAKDQGKDLGSVAGGPQRLEAAGRKSRKILQLLPAARVSIKQVERGPDSGRHQRRWSGRKDERPAPVDEEIPDR